MLFHYAKQFLDRPAPPPSQKTTTEDLIKNMTDRSARANAPSELKPTGRWATGAGLVDEFRQRRDRMIHYLNETKDPLRQRHAQWGPGVIEVYQALHTIPAHTERHLAQINEVKAAQGYPK
jgi:hypothetical protein